MLSIKEHVLTTNEIDLSLGVCSAHLDFGPVQIVSYKPFNLVDIPSPENVYFAMTSAVCCLVHGKKWQCHMSHVNKWSILLCTWSS